MKKPVHNVAMPFPVEQGELVVGGTPVSRLAARVGQTPFYVYDRRLISERVAHLRWHLPRELRLHYAIKANPMPAVVQHLATLVDGFDLASMGEMQVALDTTMPAAKISIAGPGKSRHELSCAIAAGVTINMESEFEMDTIAALAATLHIRPRVAIRVNPDFELKSSGMKMGGGPKQFGVDAERVPAMLKRLGALDLDFIGDTRFLDVLRRGGDRLSLFRHLAVGEQLDLVGVGCGLVISLGVFFDIGIDVGENLAHVVIDDPGAECGHRDFQCGQRLLGALG
ncbi:MAG: hypothetical protein HY273_02325 [Gammaproteobacteria bacterium]|nr:hypothetical protein [Gammaproteobacteria bacterium]